MMSRIRGHYSHTFLSAKQPAHALGIRVWLLASTSRKEAKSRQIYTDAGVLVTWNIWAAWEGQSWCCQ